MIRRLVAPAVAALVGTLLSAPQANAADLPAPTPEMLNLTHGQTVSQLEPLELVGLTNQTTSVRVAFGTLPVTVLPVQAQQAAGSLDTWGYEGEVQLKVSQCLDAEGLDCGDPAHLSLNVDNPEPTFTPSRPGSQRTHDFDVSLGLQVDSGTPQLRVGVDNDAPALVDPGHLLAVDVDPLPDGSHEVRAAVCSSDGAQCTTPTAHAFSVVRTVAAGFSVLPSAFSPNGDGTADEITFTYSLVDPWDDGVIRVRRVGISEPLRVIAVDPPIASGGEATLDYDGTDADGVPLPSGNYSATLAVSRTVDGEPLFTPYPVAFEVDLDVLAPTGLAPSFPSIFPHPDGYRDTATLTWSDAEPYAQVDLQVRNSADETVRLMTDVASGVAWDGRDDAAGLVPAGSYSVRLRAHDDLGNQVWTAPLQIGVSHKVLKTRTQSVTVKPEASRVPGGDVGECSRWKVPSRHGWPGSASHLSNVRCNGGVGDRSVAWTIHRIELPEAVRYRQVQLSWFGGPTASKGCANVDVSCDVGLATLYEKDGSAVQWFTTRDYLTTQYVEWAPAADVLRTGRRVKWAMSVSGGNQYDVKKFTIIYRADVLVSPG